MKARCYRLGQYEIILESNCGICWKAHGGFSDTKSGRCFIEGNVLFLGPSEEREPGFLKNEFLAHLKQFPAWDRTKYYCPSYTLYACKGGRVLDGLLQSMNIEGGRTDETAEVINHSPLRFNPPPEGEWKPQDALDSLSTALGVGESKRLSVRGSTVMSTEKTALTSLSPAAEIKHMKEKLGKAFRRCKRLIGLKSRPA